jgi:hypothetical protein
MASVIQKFDLSLVDPSYTLQIKQTLTVKPKGLYIHAAPRAGKVSLLATPSSALIASRHDELGASSGSAQVESAGTGVGLPLYVLYGSNTGTSEAFAQRVANEAPSYGASFGFNGRYMLIPHRIPSIDRHAGFCAGEGPHGWTRDHYHRLLRRCAFIVISHETD